MFFSEVARMEEALAKEFTVKAPANEHTEKLQVEQRMGKTLQKRTKTPHFIVLGKSPSE